MVKTFNILLFQTNQTKYLLESSKKREEEVVEEEESSCTSWIFVEKEKGMPGQEDAYCE